MKITRKVVLAWQPAAAAGLIALAGCAGQQAPSTTEAASAGSAAARTTAPAHPETFAAAKALATQRGVPLLVDFFSPS